MTEEPIEHRTLIQDSSQSQAVRRRRNWVFALEPQRFGEPGESAGVVTLVNVANSIFNIHPHQPPLFFAVAGIRQQPRFALAFGSRFFATSSRSGRFSQGTLMEGRDRGDDRDCHQKRRHASREPGYDGLAAAPPPCALDPADRTRRDRLSREPAVQVGRHGLSRAITTVPVFFQALQRDGLEVAIDSRAQRAGGERLLFPNLAQGLVHRVGVKRWAAAEELVEHSTEAIDVDRGGHLVSISRHLLGRHVGGRPQDEPGVRQSAIVLHALGESEIGDVRLIVFIKQDIRWFQIAVQNAAHVCVVDRQSDVLHQPRDGLRVIPEPGGVPFEIAACDQLEGDEGYSAILAHLVDGHDLGMVEPGDRCGLDAEPVDRVGIILESGGPDRLQRHDTAELLLSCFENDSHPATGDFFDQVVLAEIGACALRAVRC